MTSRPLRRPFLATLAAIAFATVSQGHQASAGPFNLAVETWTYPVPVGGGSGAVVVEFSADLGLGPYDWYLDYIDVPTNPRREDGETLYFDVNPNWMLPGMGWLYPPGSQFQGLLGAYLIWPESPRGRFSGGVVTLYAFRFDEWGNRYDESESVTFGFTVPGPAAAPEPASAISAAVAALAGVVVAARRRLRRPA